MNVTLGLAFPGANQGALDINGLDAISIAVNAANADIVTLLRLAKLNEEIKESELGNPGKIGRLGNRSCGQRSVCRACTLMSWGRDVKYNDR